MLGRSILRQLNLSSSTRTTRTLPSLSSLFSSTAESSSPASTSTPSTSTPQNAREDRDGDRRPPRRPRVEVGGGDGVIAARDVYTEYTPRVSVETREMIAEMARANPEKWTPKALAERFQFSPARISALLTLAKLEAADPEAASRTEVEEAAKYFSTRTSGPETGALGREASTRATFAIDDFSLDSLEKSSGQLNSTETPAIEASDVAGEGIEKTSSWEFGSNLKASDLREASDPTAKSSSKVTWVFKEYGTGPGEKTARIVRKPDGTRDLDVAVEPGLLHPGRARA